MEKIRESLLLYIAFSISFYFLSNSNNNNNISTLTFAQLEPISTIQKLSDKGYFIVQFKSGIGPTTPEIPTDIVFLNASFPTTGREGTFSSSPNTANQGGDTELAQSNLAIPVDYNIAPVQSYDLTIQDDQGNTLWQKVNNNLYGISGKNFVILNGYQGNITISIDNITLLPAVEETIFERQYPSYEETDRTVKDSVKFNLFVDRDNVIKADPSKNQFTIHPNQRQQ